MSDTYERLIALLDAHKASYRLIDHAPASIEAMLGGPPPEADAD
jgi:hypothetical protein